MSPSVLSSAAQAAQSKQAANLWRVVVESRPSGAASDALARVRAFDDYEAAWQFAQASQSEKTLVLLVDPQGRVLIDTNHGHALVRADRQVVDLPPGTHQWMMASGRYELIESAPVDRRKNGAHGAEEAVEAEVALASLLGRRSVSPKRLGHPGPSLSQIDLMLQAALRAPDHGGLHPWRVIEFRDDQRAALADRFEQEKLKRDPLASALDRRRARDHALRPPVLLAFVVCLRARTKVPVREQWLAGGAALGNLLNAAHQLGFGAILLSGERCFDEDLLKGLGLGADEFLAGFISIGRIVEEPPKAPSVLSARVWSCWTAETAQRSTDVSTTPRSAG